MRIELTPAPACSSPYHILHHCLCMSVEIFLGVVANFEGLDALADHLVEETDEVVGSCLYRAFLKLVP